MLIKAKPRELMPEGQHAVTITEINDLGVQDTLYGKKHQLYVVFTNAAGKSIRKYYTASTNEKSNLYKDVKAFTGKAPTKEFDTDTLLNRSLQIIVAHEEGKDGMPRDKIVAFLKVGPGRPAGAEYAGVPEADTNIPY